MQIKAILFDLDDTLIPSSRIYAQIYEELKLDKRLLEAAKSEVKARIVSGHVSSHNRLLYFKRYLELQDAFSASGCLDLMTKYENSLSRRVNEYWLSANISEILRDLQASFSLGICTNETARTQLIKLSAMTGVTDTLQTILTSEEVGVEKPAHEIFHAALAALATPPEQTLFVGDSVRCDLEPASELGMQVVGTCEFVDKDFEGHGFRWVRTMNELSKLLRQNRSLS